MKNPSTLALALALAAGAARAQPIGGGGDLMAVSALENTPPPLQQGAPPAGVRTEHDLVRNRDFLVNDKDGTVALADYTTGTTSPFVSLDKGDDPVVRSYSDYLSARRVRALTINGSAFVPNTTGTDDAGGGGGGGSMMHMLGLTPPPGGMTPGTAPGSIGKGAGLPGSDGRSAGPGGFAAQAFTGAGDGSTGGAANPMALGTGIGKMMASIGSMGSWLSGSAGGGANPTPGVGSGAGLGGDGSGITAGSALAPDQLQLNFRSTIRADVRSRAVEKQVLGSGVLVTPGKAVPGAGDDNAAPLGGATTNSP